VQPRILSVDDVVLIYQILVKDFAQDQDPIAPAGVRSQALLESAVGRQLTGGGGVLKYPQPVDNAASLMFGLCNDHPFHNGNKRTALVAMLVHLDRNHFSLERTSQDDLYTMILSVATHSIGLRSPRRRAAATPGRRSADEEVSEIASWIRARVRRVVRGERHLTFRELKRILEAFGFSLASPHANSIDVVRYEQQKKGFLSRETVRVARRIGKIGYRDEGTVVALKDMKRVRELCQLREEDGVPSDTFYESAAVIDAFVNRYRTLLRRLGRR
jgi:prophage maintenance system killer protein